MCQTEFCFWYKNNSIKVTLLLSWSHRYQNSTIVMTGWLLRNIHFSNGNGSFSDLTIRATLIRNRNCYFNFRFFSGVCVAHLLSFLWYVFCFVRLRSVTCAHGYMCLWVFHSCFVPSVYLSPSSSSSCVKFYISYFPILFGQLKPNLIVMLKRWYSTKIMEIILFRSEVQSRHKRSKVSKRAFSVIIFCCRLFTNQRWLVFLYGPYNILFT